MLFWIFVLVVSQRFPIVEILLRFNIYLFIYILYIHILYIYIYIYIYRANTKLVLIKWFRFTEKEKRHYTKRNFYFYVIIELSGNRSNLWEGIEHLLLLLKRHWILLSITDCLNHFTIKKFLLICNFFLNCPNREIIYCKWFKFWTKEILDTMFQQRIVLDQGFLNQLILLII